MDEVTRLLDLMIQRAVRPDAFVHNTLMDGFCLTGRFDRAMKIFFFYGE